MRSARSIYRLNVGLAALGSVAVAFAAAAAVRGIALAAPPGDRLVAACRRFLVPHVTVGTLSVLALGALWAVTLALGARTLAQQFVGYRHFIGRLQVLGSRRIGGTAVTVTDSREPEAFCAGFLRPRIFVSSGALDLLSPLELRAVVAHEAHHALRRDPLRIMVLSVLSDALFFLPALPRLTERYRQAAELAADDAALAVTEDASALASALVAFGERDGPGIVGIAPERVDHLLGQPVRWRLPVSLLLIAVATVAGILAVAIPVARATAGPLANLPLLAAESCMVAMVAMPALLITILGRRQWQRWSPR